MLNYQTIKSGDIIISSPDIDNGVIFNKSVIYIITHDKTGTSGVIINKLLNNIDGNIISSSLQIESSSIPKVMSKNLNGHLSIYFGGPIEQEKGIILHSNDYRNLPLMKVTDDISISADAKIIADIATNTGPKHKMLILGYTAWLPNQLLSEIKRNDWLLLPNKNSESIFDLVFNEEDNFKWERALKLVGINLANFTNPGNA